MDFFNQSHLTEHLELTSRQVIEYVYLFMKILSIYNSAILSRKLAVVILLPAAFCESVTEKL